MIQGWSDTSTMLTTATGAYAGHPLTISFEGVTAGTAVYTAWLDQLSLLERFNGRTFRVVPTGTAPVTVSFSSAQMTLLDQSYRALKESAYNALFLQTRGKPYLDAIGLNTDTAGNVVLNFSAMETLLNTRVSNDTASGVTDIADLARAAHTDLKASGWDSYLFLGNTLNGMALTDPVKAALAEMGIYATGSADTGVTGTANDDLIYGNLRNSIKEALIGEFKRAA
jgi:hypothetical protein